METKNGYRGCHSRCSFNVVQSFQVKIIALPIFETLVIWQENFHSKLSSHASDTVLQVIWKIGIHEMPQLTYVSHSLAIKIYLAIGRTKKHHWKICCGNWPLTRVAFYFDNIILLLYETAHINFIKCLRIFQANTFQKFISIVSWTVLLKVSPSIF